MVEALSDAVISHQNYAYAGPLVLAQFQGADIYVPPSPTAQRRYLAHLIEADPAVFLVNYHSLLTPAQLSLFADHSDPSVRRLQQDYSSSMQAVLARNRRFAHLQELIHQGDYFSEEAVEAREPELYTEYVGQYRDMNEKADMPSCLSEAIQSLADRTERLKRVPEEKKVVSSSELAENEDLLLRLLHEKYLSTPDPAVDLNEEYDDLQTMTRDAEEKWFESGLLPPPRGPSDTGEQDY